MAGGNRQCARGGCGQASVMATRPTVYYDGGCPVCAREINLYRGGKAAGSFDWVDVTQVDEVALGTDLPREAALAQMHVRRADGSLATGAAAFGEIWRRIPGLRWLGQLLGIRPFSVLAEVGYVIFLRMRRLWR